MPEPQIVISNLDYQELFVIQSGGSLGLES